MCDEGRGLDHCTVGSTLVQYGWRGARRGGSTRALVTDRLRCLPLGAIDLDRRTTYNARLILGIIILAQPRAPVATRSKVQ